MGVPTGLIAVVRAGSAAECLTIVRGLAEGGVSVVEITFTVPGAVEVIAELVAEAGATPGLVVGAGTVLDAAQCAAAIEAGSAFVVSPVTDLEVVAEARRASVACVGGALTPSEVLAAMRAGVDAVKLFPIGSAGGPSYLRALREPFPGLRAVVSGGVRPEDVPAYLESGAHAVCMGGALIDRRAALAGDVAAVAERAAKTLASLGPPET